MFDNNSSTDHDDAKILEKFSNLLNKYQNHIEGEMSHEHHENLEASDSQRDSSGTNLTNIPVLTEGVVLDQSIMHSQARKNSAMRYILDVALKDVGIEMDKLEREALAGALETRLSQPSQSDDSTK